MREKILNTLNELRIYALAKGADVSFYYHEEDSYLMRFANSAISLNTNEHLIRLEVTAFEGNKRAIYAMITDLNKVDDMKQGVDTACEMVKHVMPLTYKPTVPEYSSPFIDESGFDPDLVQMSNEEKLAFFNQVVDGLETDQIKLSGIFSCGSNIIAAISTRSEHPYLVQTSDAQVSIVLAHSALKWEVQSEQSAQQKGDLDAAAMRTELATLLHHYTHDTPQQIPLGKYDVVFGTAAIADMLNFARFIGFNGGLMKRGYSFLKEESIGQKVFSEHFTFSDDPSRRETFPFRCDLYGIPRNRFPMVENGAFKAFAWYQDDADEFNRPPTGHTVPHHSLCMAGGTHPIATLEELLNQPRESDILYIPFLHYMNIVNPSKGIVTGSSRFGALLLKQDGSIVVPYNVRLTQSLLDIFSDKIAWIARETLPYNTSLSYGARNPTSIIVPRFMRVNDLEISHSNSSY
jgi:predicted Zn-dependent protease